MFLLIFLIYIFFNLRVFSFIQGLLYIFVSFLFMFLQVLFFTTCERKILALTQRRVGPKVVGDMGRLQYFADAIKLIGKTYTSPRKINSSIFSGCAVAAFWFSWYGYSNLSFNYGEDIINIEYNIFFSISCSLGFSIVWLVSGWSSVSKYAMLGCIRSALQIISYEILMSGVFLILFVITGTSSFEMFMDLQVNFAILLFVPTIGIVCFIATLMETNRPPFDLSEAESDVVAGYTIEYTGIMFGLFYLGEYITIFTNSFILVILFSGGLWTIFDYISVGYGIINTYLCTFKLNYNISQDLSLNYSWIFGSSYDEVDSYFIFLKKKDLYVLEYNSITYFWK